jgi:heme/copper-type cytochrome/quinol oxidase subunit 2
MTDTLKVENNWKPTIQALSDSLNQNLKDISTEISKNNKEEKLFNHITYDTAFTVIVTITIFVLGFLIDRAVKYVEKRKERKRLRYFYVNNVTSMTEKLFPNVNKLYREFYFVHDIDSGIPMTPPKVLAGDIERLDKIEFDKLYHSFSNKKTLSI